MYLRDGVQVDDNDGDGDDDDDDDKDNADVDNKHIGKSETAYFIED